MHFRHRWFEVERIGVIVTERCAVCPKTRVRVRAAVSDSAAPGNPGTPDHPRKRLHDRYSRAEKHPRRCCAAQNTPLPRRP